MNIRFTLSKVHITVSTFTKSKHFSTNKLTILIVPLTNSTFFLSSRIREPRRKKTPVEEHWEKYGSFGLTSVEQVITVREPLSLIVSVTELLR